MLSTATYASSAAKTGGDAGGEAPGEARSTAGGERDRLVRRSVRPDLPRPRYSQTYLTDRAKYLCVNVQRLDV